MITCKECGNDEICVGNTEIKDRVKWLNENGINARLGNQAYDINGKPLPVGYCWPVIIRRSEAEQYDRVMMEKTFGVGYRNK